MNTVDAHLHRYDRAWGALAALLDGLDPADRATMLGGTATACNGLGEGA